ncbi:MAG: hypothetical protein ACI4RF_04135 [Eubacterium sp.]
MKKTLSFFLALCLVLSMSFTAFASEKTKSERIEEQIEGAVAFLTDGVTAYTVDDAMDYYTLVASGVDMSQFNQGFIDSVKANLDANSGKIIGTYGENLATYGAVILTLFYLDLDPEDFQGYNIVSAFEAMDPTDTSVNPYYYRVIIPAAYLFVEDESFYKAICDTYVNTYYTMGQGMATSGYYCCDNTAYFIASMSFVADEYPEVMADAFDVLEGYHTDGGYFCDPAYGTEPNCDSTALALMAYSCAPVFEDDDLDAYFAKASSVYEELCAFESDTPGVFISSYTGAPDTYATKEALMALNEYYFVALAEELFYEDDLDDEEEITTIVDEETTDNTSAKDTAKKSPATGFGATGVALALSACGAFGVTLFSKKKYE